MNAPNLGLDTSMIPEEVMNKGRELAKTNPGE